MSESTEPPRAAPVWLAVAATLLGVTGGFLMKVRCLSHVWDGFQYSALCYNDLQPLYGVRGIADGLLPYIDVQYEYPPLTGLFMHGMGRLVQFADSGGLFEATHANYFVVSAVFLTPFAIATTLMLRKMVLPGRLMLWAVGTPMILYAFHNWDLLAVAGVAWGLWALERSRYGESGAALAAGGTAKLFPAFLMGPAVLDRFAEGDRKGALRLIAFFLVVFAALNVPWIVVASGLPPAFDRPDIAELALSVNIRDPNTNGWVGIWKFHADRFPDFGTHWYWLRQHGKILFPSEFWRIPAEGQTSGYRDFVSVASFLLFGLGSLAFMWRGWKRKEEPDGYPVAAVGLGILTTFLLFSKVHSPQYALWMIPFLALLSVKWRYIAAYLAFDIGVFVSGFYWFTVFSSPSPAWQGIFEVAVLGRTAALAAIAVAAWSGVRLRPSRSSV